MKEIDIDFVKKDLTTALDVNIEYSQGGKLYREQIYIKPTLYGYGVYRYNEIGSLIEVLYESSL